MEHIRLILIVLHVFITILLIYNLYPHPSAIIDGCHIEQHDSLTVTYMNHSFSIALYHSSCIFVLWYSQRYGARIIRASGILLIGELFQVLTVTIQHAIRKRSLSVEELAFDMIHFWTFFAAIFLTFRLAKDISKKEKDLIHLELLSTAVSEELIDGRELALV
ncbi:hypothetical protein I4U23_007095 [Adineta vaga]|nr:hypothetical protein I4U23_007095 [Adineta vaga]